MSRMATSGSCSRDQLDGLVAPAGLAHHLVALLLEGLLEVEADDGLVLGDHDAGRHRVVPLLAGRFGFEDADRTATGRRRPAPGPESVRRVGAISRWRRSAGRAARPGPAPAASIVGQHRRRGGGRMASAWRARLAVLLLGQRRLRHQRPEPGVVGLVGQVGQLLVGHGQLAAGSRSRSVTSVSRRSTRARDMRRVYGGCHARWIMSDASQPVGDLAPDPSGRSERPGRGRPDGLARDRCGRRRADRRARPLLRRFELQLGLARGAPPLPAPPLRSTAARAPLRPTKPLDPTSAIRLLPNAAGADLRRPIRRRRGRSSSGASVDPVSKEGLARPVQVGLLAQGKVLIQYSASASPADVTDLEGLAGGDIVVAPNPTMADPFVATAWRTRQICPVLDLAALRQFATLNANRLPTPRRRRPRPRADPRADPAGRSGAPDGALRWSGLMRRCWNRHTGRAQTPLPFGACGFESHPPHSPGTGRPRSPEVSLNAPRQRPERRDTVTDVLGSRVDERADR